ncbi:MAG TPA: Mur ligase family protein [Acidimicrobiales bacterium]|nr:Mur ligase family protein [Acidimicrobiales bacterium]
MHDGGRGAAGRSRDELVAWLDGHTDFEKAMPTRALAPTLARIEELCRLMGDPERACPVIHLTGTNGKGSTSRILTELLRAAGLRVGTYTSPNLARVNERLALDTEPIGDEELAEVLEALALIEPMLEEPPTRFELLTAAAFRWFADIAVDVAVVEVGLGGRWDATSVVSPAVAVVTNVSYDHVEILGPTLADIAREKAGIVKPGAVLVLGEPDPDLAAVFLAAAAEAGGVETWLVGEAFGVDANRVAVGGRLLDLRTPQAVYPEVFLPLHGAHQGANAACALAAAEAFFGAALDPGVVEEAFAAVEVPGRLEVVGRGPLVVLDGAHNAAGAAALGAALREEFPTGGERVAVVGMLHGRDPSAILQELAAAGVRTVVACTAPSPRALPATEVAEAARALGLRALAAETVDEAVTLALARVHEDGLLLVTGSLYVVTEARARFVSSAPSVSD